MPIVGQFASLARAGSFLLPGGAFESIATVTVGSGGASSIEFTSIPGGFQHLQVRLIGRSSYTGSVVNLYSQYNNDTGSNYAWHVLYGNGATVSAQGGATQIQSGYIGGFTAETGTTANTFSAALIDILDYANTSKNKVSRSSYGLDANGSGLVGLSSSLWTSTAAITSIKLQLGGNSNWVQYSTAALYGIKAP